jgi:Flp pilus assembly protein TadG
VVLMALLALIIDAGWIYADRRQAQNAADAAALAGARALCDRGATSAREAAVDFADRNLDADLSPDVNIIVDSYNQTVEVIVTLHRSPLLGQLLSGTRRKE